MLWVKQAAREEEIAAAIARDETSHRRVVIITEPHDDILDGRHTLAVEVTYGTI